MKRGLSRAVLAGALLSSAASARLYNYEDILIGERSFGMGGASMGYLGDTSAIYSNPGILGFSESPQFAASVSGYNRIDTRTGEYVSLFRSAADNISRGGFLAVPSMVGGHFKWHGWSWGGGILVPQAFKINGKLNFNTADVASYESKDDALWAGAFAARRVGAHHALGLSMFYVTSSRNEKFTFLNGVDGGTPLIRFAENAFDGSGLVLIFGGAYEVNDRVILGYSIRTPGIPFGGRGYAFEYSSSGTTSIDEDFKRSALPIPYRLSAGISWQINPNLLVAADLHFYGPMNQDLSPSGYEALKVKAKETLNVALGVEYKLWSRSGFRLGMFSNMSAARFVPRGLTAINDRVHMFGGTAALFWEKDTGSISLGGYTQGGQGSSIALDNPTGGVVPRSNYIYGFVVGSSYRF